jgi:hypothetical protein
MISNSRRVFSSFLTSLLCAALIFTGIPFSPARGQAPSGGARFTGSPNPNLPDLNTIRNRPPADPIQRPPTPATRCRHFDRACQARTQQSQNLAPADRLRAQAEAQTPERLFDWRVNNISDSFGLDTNSGATESSSATTSAPVPVRINGGDNSLPRAAAPTTASVTQTLDNLFATARVDEINRTGTPGEDLYSGNFRWSTPLVSLPGRAGFDLDLTLYYNSLVWLKSGSAMLFDHDQSWLSPGFSLGFPVIKGPYTNQQTGLSSYLMLTPAGGAVELRQISSNPLVYEARDGSFTQLTFTATGNQVLTMTNGTSYTYTPGQGIFIKDRNGNYMRAFFRQTGAYNDYDTIVDSLGRSLKFNYGTNGELLTITQNWDGALTPKVLITFHYTSVTLSTNWQAGLMMMNNLINGTTSFSVLDSIDFLDGTTYKFLYNGYVQVKEVQRYDNGYLHAKVAYNLPATAAAQDACPRFTTRSDAAADWNNFNWIVTSFCFNDSNCGWTATHNWGSVTTPDGTKHQEYFGTTGTQRGLSLSMETYEGLVKKKWTETTWQQGQDSPCLGANYVCNPRVIETNVYDDRNGNGVFDVSIDKRRRTGFQYSGNNFNLPTEITEYKDNATEVLRRTVINYELSTDYLVKRIIGMPTQRELRDTNNALLSKVAYVYDEADRMQNLPNNAKATNHLNPAPTDKRGNLTTVRRYDVSDPNNSNGTAVENKLYYFITGAVASTKDGLNHETKYDYTDSFLPLTGNQTTGSNYKTFAYPTTITVTDPDPFNTTIQYHYALGVVRRTTDPKGASTLSTYDGFGRLERVTNEVNGAYTRYAYGFNEVYSYVQSFTTIESGQEFYSIAFVDGHRRQRGVVSEHPGSIGGFKGVYREYDVLGRLISITNPTEMNDLWQPAGDDVPNGQQGGWRKTEQTYDWQSRPLVTTNQDGTIKTISYDGCGCAGGQTVTISDEGDGVEVNNQPRRRKQKLYHDVLGRVKKIEVLDWNGNVYSTTVNTYNERDQLIYQREFQQSTTQAQDEATTCPSSTTCQRTKFDYDGHGRLAQRWLPIYCTPPSPGSTSCNETAPYETYSYNKDDLVQTFTDPRGASTTYGYNNRHLVTNLTYGVATGVAATPNVTIAYDAGGNRDWLDDGTQAANQHAVDYVYDNLSRLQSETRTFNGLTGSYQLSYTYNLAGQVKTVTDNHFNTVLNYNHDKAGQVTSVTGTGYAGSGQSDFTSTTLPIKYRAWGAVKKATYGNSITLDREFNTRMLMTLSALTGGKSAGTGGFITIGGDYEYYPDGRAKFADDLLGAGVSSDDRSYGFDHAGRLERAHTGAEAWGSTGGDIPYRQFYSYDVWNNLTSRDNTLYTCTSGFGFGAYYVNNRDTSLTLGHDAAGNMTQDYRGNTSIVRQHSFDAARRKVAVADSNITITESYGGDGQVVKRVETHVAPAYNNTTYYLRSSVLGGAAIVELNGQGQKQKGYIFANGEILAEQRINQSGNAIGWRHIVPITGDVLTSSQDGFYDSQLLLDPLGAEVGFNDPCLDNQNPDYASEFGAKQLYIEGGDPFDAKGGCTLDGIAVPCNDLLRRIDSGSVQAQGPRGIPGEVLHLGGGLIYGRYGTGSHLDDEGDRVIDFREFSGWLNFQGGQGGGRQQSQNASNDGQLSPCLRDALRQFFPSQAIHNNRTYSPIDDARFRSGLPSWVLSGVSAITLGLNVYYDPSQVTLNGGNFESLKTIVEELAHTEQFLMHWQNIANEVARESDFTVTHDNAVTHWKADYLGESIRGWWHNGEGYKNNFEWDAKTKVFNILSPLTSKLLKEGKTDLCGYDIVNMSLETPNWKRY